MQNPRMAMSEAIPTIKVNIYPVTSQPSKKEVNPSPKQTKELGKTHHWIEIKEKTQKSRC